MLTTGRRRLLDLGCGPGKLSRPLAAHFALVTAVDPSAAMLRQARQEPGGEAANIRWLEGKAEEVALGAPDLDLITAGASLHWIDHARLLPKLKGLVGADHAFAIVEGDGAHRPPWRDDWTEFLRRWIRILRNEDLEPDRHDRWLAGLKPWLDITADSFFTAPVQQSVEDFVRCQHSRQTFAPAAMGRRLAAFDAELTELLAPHATDGLLDYTVGTRVSSGRLVA